MDKMTKKSKSIRVIDSAFGAYRTAAIVMTLVIICFGQATHAQTSRLIIDSIGSKFDTDRGEQMFDTGSGLSGYLAYASVNSPSVRAAFYEWKAAVEKTGYVGALPDPVLSYGYFAGSVETRVGPQNQKFGLKQSFPWFGTLGSRRDIAAHVADAEYQKFIARTLRTYYFVKKAFYEYYFLGRDIELTRENLELLKFWESIARARYRVALADHPDVIKAQVELGLLEDRLQSLLEQRSPHAAEIRAAVNLPPQLALPIPSKITVSEQAIDTDSVMKQVLENNPDIAALANLTSREKAGMRLAGKSSWPGFTISADYIEVSKRQLLFSNENGKDAFVLSAAINLPIWFGKNSAKRKESRARYKMAEYNHHDAVNSLEATTSQVLFHLSDARRRVSLYRDGLVPKAQQSLNASYTAYQANQTDFLSLLDAQRQLLDFQLQYERSLVDLAITQAQLEMLTGNQLFDNIGQ